MKAGLERIWKSWDIFWFHGGDLKAIAAFRCVFATSLFVMYGIRALDFPLFYGESGMFPADAARDFFNQTFHPVVFLFPDTDTALAACYGLFMLSLLALALGLIGVFATWIVLILHLMFVQRNFAIVYGADSVACFWLFFLGFCRHNQHFNLWRWWKGSVDRVDIAPDPLTSMGYRLIQVQLAVIYAYTGLEKLKGDQWWEGSALWYVMGNSQMVPFELSFMQHVPWVVATMTFATLIFEIYFPFAVLAPTTRRLWLGLGVAMHLGTALFMGLPFFTMIMLASYLLFIRPETLDAIFDMSWIRTASARVSRT